MTRVPSSDINLCSSFCVALGGILQASQKVEERDKTGMNKKRNGELSIPIPRSLMVKFAVIIRNKEQHIPKAIPADKSHH